MAAQVLRYVIAMFFLVGFLCCRKQVGKGVQPYPYPSTNAHTHSCLTYVKTIGNSHSIVKATSLVLARLVEDSSNGSGLCERIMYIAFHT